jgi:predicted N-acetyltransferase YhbS
LPYRPPAPIVEHHRLDGFDCAKEPLNDWLKRRALASEGASARTFVVADQEMRVCGYYALAMGAVTRKELPGKLRHGLPNPVPVMILARLAVDKGHAGAGIGKGLLRDALARSLKAADHAGMRALIVHAIDDEAVGFYAHYEFQLFPPGMRTLFMAVETIRRAVTG